MYPSGMHFAVKEIANTSGRHFLVSLHVYTELRAWENVVHQKFTELIILDLMILPLGVKGVAKKWINI